MDRLQILFLTLSDLSKLFNFYSLLLNFYSDKLHKETGDFLMI